MKTIAAGEFKAQCLHLMDEVQKTRDEITITKHGKPVAKLVPIRPEGIKSIYGYLQGMVTVSGDIVAPIDEKWDASE